MVRGPISLVIVSVVLLAVVAVVAVGPRALDGILPPAAVEFLETMGGATSFGTGTARQGDTPADFLEDSSDGLVAQGPIAAHTGNRPVFIEAAITGYQTRISSDIPAEITTIRPILGCMPTPPQPGTVVGHATSGTSDLELALSTYSDAQLAEAVQVFVNVYRSTGQAVPSDGGGEAYQAYDVAVTETGAPVYLVLENRYGNRIWNLHLAPGAQIERVILLGGDQAGVANLDPVVPVEVILNDGLSACGIQPAYPLNPGHLFFQSVQNGALSSADAEARLATISAAVEAYDIWFRDSFGVLAGESRVGFDQGTLSVIGPLPGAADPKAVYTPIAGTRIRTTQDQFFEISGQVAEGQDFAARVRAIATGFAFGDLATLRQGVDF